MPNANVLTRKLELFGQLSSSDRDLLDNVISPARLREAGTRITSEGDDPENVHLVLGGLACRSKLLPSGQRHIFAFLVPGDFCDLHVFILKAMDHDIDTLSKCRMVEIPRKMILELSSRPEIARALWWATLVDEGVLREWLVNLGQREAEERIAHLFCELHLRMQSVGLSDGGDFHLPITQIVLADAMGISSVHANRSLQTLRGKGLIEFRSGRVTIPDVEKLKHFSDFNPNYLHLEGGKRDAGASTNHMS